MWRAACAARHLGDGDGEGVSVGEGDGLDGAGEAAKPASVAQIVISCTPPLLQQESS